MKFTTQKSRVVYSVYKNFKDTFFTNFKKIFVSYNMKTKPVKYMVKKYSSKYMLSKYKKSIVAKRGKVMYGTPMIIGDEEFVDMHDDEPVSVDMYDYEPVSVNMCDDESESVDMEIYEPDTSVQVAPVSFLPVQVVPVTPVIPTPDPLVNAFDWIRSFSGFFNSNNRSVDAVHDFFSKVLEMNFSHEHQLGTATRIRHTIEIISVFLAGGNRHKIFSQKSSFVQKVIDIFRLVSNSFVHVDNAYDSKGGRVVPKNPDLSSRQIAVPIILMLYGFIRKLVDSRVEVSSAFYTFVKSTPVPSWLSLAGSGSL
jgi:hypothetical protein